MELRGPGDHGTYLGGWCLSATHHGVRGDGSVEFPVEPQTQGYPATYQRRSRLRTHDVGYATEGEGTGLAYWDSIPLIDVAEPFAGEPNEGRSADERLVSF